MGDSLMAWERKEIDETKNIYEELRRRYVGNDDADFRASVICPRNT